MSLYTQRIHSWIVNDALPLWSTAGWDKENASFVERLTIQGEPDFAAPKRVRVQARQIYVYAHAAALGVYPKGLDLARKAFEFVIANAWLEGGGFAHLLDRQGNVVDPKCDTYDHAFLLLAFAWLYRATKDPAAAQAIERVAAILETQLRHPRGGYLEDDRASLPRRQNPHMHLLEAFLAAFEATGDVRYLDRAREILELFRTSFFDPRHGVLREFFADDWAPAAEDAGSTIEPGHHFEWVWLLNRFSSLTDTDPLPEQRALYEFAVRYGLEMPSDVAVDEVDIAGRVRKKTKRCWPQTEALKAELALAEGAPVRISPRADAVAGAIFRYYLEQGVRGGWVDVIDENNRPISAMMPASTLYHVFLAFTEYLEAADFRAARKG